MRQLDQDDAQPLGPPIRREQPKEAPKLQPVPGKPGLMRDADGKLQTAIPENDQARYYPVVPIWWSRIIWPT